MLIKFFDVFWCVEVLVWTFGMDFMVYRIPVYLWFRRQSILMYIDKYMYTICILLCILQYTNALFIHTTVDRFYPQSFQSICFFRGAGNLGLCLLIRSGLFSDFSCSLQGFAPPDTVVIEVPGVGGLMDFPVLNMVYFPRGY